MLNEDLLNDLEDLDSGEPSNNLQPSDHDEDSGQEQGASLYRQSELLRNPKFLAHMQTVSGLIDQKISNNSLGARQNEPEYIQRSNEFAAQIDREIAAIFRWVKQAYAHRFPELESIVTQPALYCRTVREVERFDREGGDVESLRFPFLSNHQAISLKIALSSLHSRLGQAESTRLLTATETVGLLHQHHNVLMMYLESCMQLVAPNLCELVGSLTASKLISAAGGVAQLAGMPACNIQVMGGQRAAQVGLAQVERNHTGLFSQMDAVRDAPKKFQIQLVRMLASNTAKCARADQLHSSKGLGARLREEMYERFEKIQQEGGLYRVEQPLPVPDLQPKKKRGGKRHRKTKELYEMSELRKQQNRVNFGEPEEEVEEGVGLGLLSQGAGKLRVAIKKQKLNVSKGMAARMSKKSGLQSSLNLGAVQGMELINPDQSQRQQNGKDTIFSKSSGFQTVLNNKFGSYK